jgi:hypothetical protein
MRATRQAQSVENLRQSGRVADITDPTLLTDAVNLARFVAVAGCLLSAAGVCLPQ